MDSNEEAEEEDKPEKPSSKSKKGKSSSKSKKAASKKVEVEPEEQESDQVWLEICVFQMKEARNEILGGHNSPIYNEWQPLSA